MYVAREAEAGGTSSARRRRERRLRSMLRHERMAVAMALAEALHHSSGLRVMERAQHAALRGQKTGTRAGVAGPAPVTEYVAPAPAVAPFSTPAVSFEAPAPVVGYVAPAPAVTYAAPAPMVGFVSPAPSVTFAAPAPVIDFVAPAPSVAYVAPAPVLEYSAPAPAVSVVAPSLQLRPAFTAAAVSTGVNLDAEFGCSASQVNLDAEFVGSASQVNLDAEFVGSASQASPHVVSAGDLAEDFAVFPVVQEQVLVGLRPAPPSEAAGPQGAAATGGYVAGGAPLLAVLSLRGFDGVDDITAKFLLQQALVLKEKEEEERVKREQEQLQRQEDQEEARLSRLHAERDALLVLGLETLSSQQKKRLNGVLDEREAILDRWERRRVEKRRKKKKKLPKVSSHSSCGRARRRQRQWLGCIAGFSGDDVPRAWLLEGFHTSLVFMAVSVFCARLGSHWIHAFWYVAMCVSTALAVMSFTVPLNGCTSDATATVVISCSSLSRRQIPCCGGVCVAMSCGGGFFSPGSASDSIWDSVKPMTGKLLLQLFPVFSVRWVYLHAELLVQQLRRILPRQLQLFLVQVDGQVSQ